MAILTNLYDAHLDYHGTKTEYANAKANITKNQTNEDYFIVNDDQEESFGRLHAESKAKLFPFQ